MLKPGGLGSSGSSILNLPILGQENQIQTTSRGMKGIESSKQLFNNNINREENKISGTVVSNYEAQGGLNLPNTKNPSYYSRGSVAAPGAPLSPASQKDGGQALIG